MNFTRQVTELGPEGREIVHVEIGQPDFQTFPHINLNGIQAIAAEHTRNNPPEGLPGLSEAIAADAGERRWISVQPEQVVVGLETKSELF